jgi:microcystin-dependent protein
MSNYFLGSVKMFGGNFAPRGFMFADGQSLSIAQNSALFALLGTTYGGDGQNTFNLPDLRGCAPMHFGTGPGLSTRTQGERGGVETVALAANQMPLHTHTVRAGALGTKAASPAAAMFASGATAHFASGSAPANATADSRAIASAGNGAAHNNMMPYLAINFIVAVEGIFPSRN